MDKWLRSIVNQVMKQRRATNAPRNDFLQAIMDHSKNGIGNYKFNECASSSCHLFLLVARTERGCHCGQLSDVRLGGIRNVSNHFNLHLLRVGQESRDPGEVVRRVIQLRAES